MDTIGIIGIILGNELQVYYDFISDAYAKSVIILQSVTASKTHVRSVFLINIFQHYEHHLLMTCKGKIIFPINKQICTKISRVQTLIEFIFEIIIL